MDLKKYIAEIEDFPKKGVNFKDITPLMGDGEAFSYACMQMVEFAKKLNADIIVGPEARGFIFGCPVAALLKIGFIPIRKPQKLPRKTVEYSYEYEYSSNTLCMHVDAIKPGQKVVIIDDLLATGGTVDATIKLVEKLKGEVVGLAFLVELKFLNGRKILEKYNNNVLTLVQYDK